MVFVESILLLIMIGVVGFILYRLATNQDWVGLAVVTLIAVIALCFAFPAKLNFITMDLLFLNGFNLVLLLSSAAGGYWAYIYYNKSQYSRGGAITLLTLGIVLFLGLSYSSITLYLTASEYTPEELTSEPQFFSDSIVHSSQNVALFEMTAAVNNSLYHIDDDFIDLTLDEQGAVYVAPITPSGGNYFVSGSDQGFVVYRDYENGLKKISKDLEPTYKGEGLFWRHGIKHSLYFGNPFVKYDDIVSVPLIGKDGKTHVDITADQINYSFMFHVPHWHGMKVVENNKVTYFTPQQAAKKFPGRPIFPRTLAIKMIESQVADKGLYSNLLWRSDKIKFSSEDDQHVQLVRLGKDRHPYYFATLQAKNSKGLFREYLVDAIDGSFFFYEFPQDEIHQGYNNVLVTAESNSSISPWTSEYHVDMQQYFPREDQGYVLNTIVRRKHNDLTGKDQYIYIETIAVSNVTNEVLRFKNRDSVVNWLERGEVDTNSQENLDAYIKRLKNLEIELDEIVTKIQNLK